MLTRKIKEYQALSPHVVEICKPLKSLNVDGFFYVRRFQDHTFLDLTSHPHYAEHTLKMIHSGVFSSQVIIDHFWMEPGVDLWDLNPENEVNQDGKRYFSCGSGLTICDAHPSGYREFYGFYSLNPSINLNQIYLQQIDIFKRFKKFFVKQAAPLIQQSASLIQSQQLDCLTASHEYKNRIIAHQKKAAVIEGLFRSGQDRDALSQREQQCLTLLSEGKSSAEVGVALGLSRRTVENYIANMKSKWHCSKLTELIYEAGSRGDGG